MKQEKLYVIEEKTYEAHIDEEVHLYGLLHQLAFLAGKIKDRRDMENLIDTARRYGEISEPRSSSISKSEDSSISRVSTPLVSRPKCSFSILLR